MNLRINGRVTKTRRFLEKTNEVFILDIETNKEYVFIISSDVRIPRGEVVTMVAEGDVSLGETIFLTNCEVNFFITGD